MLVVAEEEALPAEALVAAHHVDAGLLAAAVALRALVQVCKGKVAGDEHGPVARRGDGEAGVTDLLGGKLLFLLYIPHPPAKRRGDAFRVQGMKAKHVKGWVAEATQLPQLMGKKRSGLILQKGTPNHRERDFPCPGNPKAPRMPGRRLQLPPQVPAPRSPSPAGDACTSLGGAGKP